MFWARSARPVRVPGLGYMQAVPLVGQVQADGVTTFAVPPALVAVARRAR